MWHLGLDFFMLVLFASLLAERVIALSQAKSKRDIGLVLVGVLALSGAVAFTLARLVPGVIAGAILATEGRL